MNSMDERHQGVPPARYVSVGPVDAFPEGRGRRVEVEGRAVAVFRVGERFHAVDDRCPHAGASLSRGTVRDGAVRCPHHGARFDLATGAVLTLQAVRNVAVYPIRVEEGEVLVGTVSRTAPPPWVSDRRLDDPPPAPEAFEPQGPRREAEER